MLSNESRLVFRARAGLLFVTLVINLSDTHGFRQQQARASTLLPNCTTRVKSSETFSRRRLRAWREGVTLVVSESVPRAAPPGVDRGVVSVVCGAEARVGRGGRGGAGEERTARRRRGSPRAAAAPQCRVAAPPHHVSARPLAAARTTCPRSVK